MNTSKAGTAWQALCLVLLLTGCTAMQSREHSNELAAMREDDEYCMGQGVRYPDPAYVSCRYQLQNGRNRRDWKNMQLAHRAAAGGTMPVSGDAYTPLERERFHCWLEPQFGFNYVFCGMGDGH
jgi:hypothetical protein